MQSVKSHREGSSQWVPSIMVRQMHDSKFSAQLNARCRFLSANICLELQRSSNRAWTLESYCHGGTHTCLPCSPPLPTHSLWEFRSSNSHKSRRKFSPGMEFSPIHPTRGDLPDPTHPWVRVSAEFPLTGAAAAPWCLQVRNVEEEEKKITKLGQSWPTNTRRCDWVLSCAERR